MDHFIDIPFNYLRFDGLPSDFLWTTNPLACSQRLCKARYSVLGQLSGLATSLAACQRLGCPHVVHRSRNLTETLSDMSHTFVDSKPVGADVFSSDAFLFLAALGSLVGFSIEVGFSFLITWQFLELKITCISREK